MLHAKAYAAYDPAAPLRPYSFERREVGPRDVAIDIKFCGVCHSDLHFAKNDLGGTKYPFVPGHEIVGTVSVMGSEVKNLRIGDAVAVGCFVNSCRTCEACMDDEEQFCTRIVSTYGGVDELGPTKGGYSNKIVVDDHFVLRVPKGMDLAATAPLLCAGITTYSPLRTWSVGPGQRVAVMGLGGLGHMGVKLAAAMGAEVTVISHSPGKRADAKRLGAEHFLTLGDEAAVKAAQGRFDLILDSVSAPHNIQALFGLLGRDGTLVMLGISTEPYTVSAFSVIRGRKRLAGSMIGGIKETQEMLDFCAQKNIVSDIELIPIQKINEAYKRLEKGDVRYRFVIDMATL